MRPSDAVDIALLAGLIYGLLIWLSQMQKRFLAVMLVVAVLYLSSRMFHMLMVAALLENGLPLILVSIVIIFQEDLRRVVARFIRSRRHGEFDRGSSACDVIADVCESLTRARQGALMVLVRDDELAPHLEGGTDINAPVDASLLLSIFDTHSPGHDGAALIDRNKLIRFGAHLPLFSGPLESGHWGTRHRAALGLSAATDAIVVLVSEETGQIRVAEHGQFTKALKKQELIDFLETPVAPQKEPRGPLQWIYEIRWGELALACCISLGAWHSLSSQLETVQRSFVIPVEYRNVGKELALEPLTSNTVRLTLSGTEHAFGYLSSNQLNLSIDATGLATGTHIIPVGPQHLRLPTTLAIYRMEPRTLQIRLDKRKSAP